MSAMSAVRNFLLAAVLGAVSASASAEWTLVVKDDKIYAAFADKDSIRKRGHMSVMHGMYDFPRQDFTPEGKGLFSTAVLREYDCKGRRVRLLSAIDFSGHMGAGTAVSTIDTPRRWEDVVEGSIDEAFWKIACGVN